MDLTSKLPDEILIEVLARLPSLGDKLRTESVSRRFQRCLVELLSTRPKPFEWSGLDGRLNGTKVREGQLKHAVQTLAKKAKFDSVFIDFASVAEVEEVLSSLANSTSDCLDKAKTLHITCDETRYLILFGGRRQVSLSLLAKVIAKCAKLSTVKLDFDVHISRVRRYRYSSRIDLGAVLQGKALTELHVRLVGYTQQQLVRLYQSLEPNTLKKIDLTLREMTPDIDALVTGLRDGAWMAVEEIDLILEEGGTELQMTQLFPSLSRLPNLHKCFIFKGEIQPDEHPFVDILNSLFTTSKVEMTLRSNTCMSLEGHTPVLTGCQTVALIRQIQTTHPDLEVGFGADGQRLILSLGNVTFEHFSRYRWFHPCLNADCVECGRLHPTVIRKLVKIACQRVPGVQQGLHLTNCQMDRCKIERSVEDLNAMVQRFNDDGVSAVSAELNEAENLVVITFEPQFQPNLIRITLDCGRCLSNSCLECIHI